MLTSNSLSLAGKRKKEARCPTCLFLGSNTESFGVYVIFRVLPVTSCAMAGSYQDFDPDSPKAIAARKARVENFLERHGFLEVNTPRNTRDVHQKVHMEPVYPLDVADQMGDERMVNSLLQLGAKKRSNTKVSIFAAARL